MRHLIEVHGARPSRVCAVTFTNKAAEEVVRRLHRELGAAAWDVTRGTLHALCAGILRDHAERVGLRRGFGIADEEYQQTLLRRLGVRPRKRRAWMLGLFTRKRLQDYRLEVDVDAVFDRYVAALRERNQADFDDLLVLVQELFARHPGIATEEAARWDHLLVDEFQDLSPVQYGIVTRLAEPHRSLFAVGDDEQSIFSWTGADPEVIQRFRTDYGVEPIVLDQNRRSTRAIFAVARQLVERNPRLFEKRLEALRDSPFAVEVHRFPDESAEAGWILDDLANDRAAHHLAWGDVAVLYRKHEIGRELERRFLEADIPCRMARGRAITDDPGDRSGDRLAAGDRRSGGPRGARGAGGPRAAGRAARTGARGLAAGRAVSRRPAPGGPRCARRTGRSLAVALHLSGREPARPGPGTGEPPAVL